MLMGVQGLSGLRYLPPLRFSVLFFAFVGLVFAPVLDAREIGVGDEVYLDLGTVAGRFGMQARWLRGDRTVRLKRSWTTIDFDRNSRFARINGTPIYLGFSTKLSGGRLFLAKSDYRHVLQSVLTPQVFSPKPGLRRIVIDPGHGGRDRGAENALYDLEENALNLDVALRLQALLTDAGYEVALTRSTDVFLSLEQRSAIANSQDADLFISIHCNAAESKAAAGIETFAMTPQGQASSVASTPGRRGLLNYPGNVNDPWNALAAFHLQSALVAKLGGPDRGLKRGRLAVLRRLNCPGALVELGFLSHGPTAQKLCEADYRQLLASGLAEGIAAYRGRLQRIR